MTTAAVRQNNINGLMPAVHAVQNGEVRVTRGRNFRFHFDGPYSGFGNKLVSQQFDELDNYSLFGLFHFDDQSVLCTPRGIYEQDCDSICWRLVKPLTPATNLECVEYDYPWSSAFVGDDYFFSHPLVGLIKYSRCNGEWSCVKLDCCGGDSDGLYTNAATTEPLFYDFNCVECVESNPIFGITEAGNRLVVLSRDTIGHSQIDNGCNLECDPFCAGGFVSSSIAKYGRPLGVRKTGNGFIALTSNGVIQATNIDSVAGYNYRLVSYYTFPINPWAIASIGEGMDTVFLSKHGLVTASLNRETIVLTPFEPEMSSWLVEKELFRNAYLHNQHAVMLTYAEETKELFVSLLPHAGQRQFNNLYSRALVLNMKYLKWSSFDQPHFVIGPVNGAHHRMHDYSLGFFGLDRALHWFNENYSNEHYNADGEIVQADLNSYVVIGPFALGNDREIELESEMQKIKIYTEGQRLLPSLQPSEEDFPTLALELDNYQEQLMIPFKAQVYTYSSADGYPYGKANKLKKTFSVLSSAFAQTYTCQSTDLYHNVVIEANRVSGYYAIKRIDVKLLASGTKA